MKLHTGNLALCKSMFGIASPIVWSSFHPPLLLNSGFEKGARCSLCAGGSRSGPTSMRVAYVCVAIAAQRRPHCWPAGYSWGLANWHWHPARGPPVLSCFCGGHPPHASADGRPGWCPALCLRRRCTTALSACAGVSLPWALEHHPGTAWSPAQPCQAPDLGSMIWPCTSCWCSAPLSRR